MDAAPLINAIIAALAGLTGALIGSRTTLRGVDRNVAAQQVTERRREQRALQDAKHTRLRAAYVELLTAAMTVRETMDLLTLVDADITAATVDDVLKPFRGMLASLNTAQAGLLLEDEGPAAVALVDEIVRVLNTYLSLLMTRKESRGVDGWRQINEQREIVARDVQALTTLGREHLAALAKPVPTD